MSELIRPLLMAMLLNAPVAAPTAWSQSPGHRFGLELHVGHGGGGLHNDELVGGGLAYRLGRRLEAAGFLTAVAARPEGRTVFAGLGLRFSPWTGVVRPYLGVGPLVTVRAYTEGHLATFESLGLEAALERRARRWRVFAEGRVVHGGGDWGQVVAGVRYH
jgi:hypothetical protein